MEDPRIASRIHFFKDDKIKNYFYPFECLRKENKLHSFEIIRNTLIKKISNDENKKQNENLLIENWNPNNQNDQLIKEKIQIIEFSYNSGNDEKLLEEMLNIQGILSGNPDLTILSFIPSNFFSLLLSIFNNKSTDILGTSMLLIYNFLSKDIFYPTISKELNINKLISLLNASNLFLTNTLDLIASLSIDYQEIRNHLLNENILDILCNLFYSVNYLTEQFKLSIDKCFYCLIINKSVKFEDNILLQKILTVLKNLFNHQCEDNINYSLFSIFRIIQDRPSSLYEIMLGINQNKLINAFYKISDDLIDASFKISINFILKFDWSNYTMKIKELIKRWYTKLLEEKKSEMIIELLQGFLVLASNGKYIDIIIETFDFIELISIHKIPLTYFLISEIIKIGLNSEIDKYNFLWNKDIVQILKEIIEQNPFDERVCSNCVLSINQICKNLHENKFHIFIKDIWNLGIPSMLEFIMNNKNCPVFIKTEYEQLDSIINESLFSIDSRTLR